MAKKKNNIEEISNMTEIFMYETEFEGASQYRTPLCFELAGKAFDLIFDDGRELLVKFIDGKNLFIAENNITEYHEYECLKCVDKIYLVHLEKKDRYPREGVTLVLDLLQGLVTGNFLKQGAVKDYERLVTRDLLFGAIKYPGMPLATKRHEFTTDLIGKKILYRYNPEFSIIHIYQKGYCRVATPKALKKIKRFTVPQEFQFEEPCLYIKVAENVYIFTWIEENAKTGTQGFMLMDTFRTNDVGLFFGVNPQGEPESYLITAIGEYIEEELVEETSPSDYF